MRAKEVAFERSGFTARTTPPVFATLEGDLDCWPLGDKISLEAREGELALFVPVCIIQLW